ncbi:MAG: hypothetical protein MJY85_04675, partial [Fibrobacter sp.]|nr:hypothetical protein [Fibrobacter sp.]
RRPEGYPSGNHRTLQEAPVVQVVVRRKPRLFDGLLKKPQVKYLGLLFYCSLLLFLSFLVDYIGQVKST